MKKLIASRKLKRTCEHCGRGFIKGNVYYKIREVFTEEYDQYIAAFEYLKCPKCKWKEDRHKERYEIFQKNCPHPEEFAETEWSYIPGECVKEPDYDYCRLCGERF